MTYYMFLAYPYILNMWYITLIMYIFICASNYVSLPDEASDVCMMLLDNCSTIVYGSLDLNMHKTVS